MSFLKTKWSQLWGTSNVDVCHDSENSSRPSKCKLTTATANGDNIGIANLQAKTLSKRASLPSIASSLRGRNWDNYGRSSCSISTDNDSDENIPSKHLLHKMASQTLRSFSNSIRSSAQMFYVAPTQSENTSLENIDPNIIISNNLKFPGNHRTSRQRPTILPPSERRESYYSTNKNSDPTIAMKQEINLPHELEVEIPDSHLLEPCHVFFSNKAFYEDNVGTDRDTFSPVINRVWPSPASIAIARPLEETRQDEDRPVQENASMGPRHCWEAGRANRHSRYEAVKSMEAVEPEDEVAPKKQRGHEFSKAVEFEEELTPKKERGRDILGAVKPEDEVIPEKQKGQDISEDSPLTTRPQGLRKVHFEIPDTSLPRPLDATKTIVRAENDCPEDTEETVLSTPVLREKSLLPYSIYDGIGLNEDPEKKQSGPRTPTIAPIEGESLRYEYLPELPPSCDTPYHITSKAENWTISHDDCPSLMPTSPAVTSLVLPLSQLKMMESNEPTLGIEEEPQHKSSFESSFDLPFQQNQKQLLQSNQSLPEVHESHISALPDTGQAETLKNSKSTDGQKSVSVNTPSTPTVTRTRANVTPDENKISKGKKSVESPTPSLQHASGKKHQRTKKKPSWSPQKSKRFE